MDDDPRVAAARYRMERLAHEDGSAAFADTATTPGRPTASQSAAYVETAIQQAIRRGDFDDLPGAGKPLENLGRDNDPNWWIRRKIEREDLRGLAPPALALRVEHARMAQTLDALSRERDVREAVEDFNERVRAARMQLLGGPPVVTPLLALDEELERWRERRELRRRTAAAQERPRRRRWWRPWLRRS